MIRLRTLVPLVLCSLLAAGAMARPSVAESKKAKADFVLRDVDGVSRRLSDYRGKWVVLEWVNFSCPAVKEQYQAPTRKMQSLQRTFQKKGVVWLLINSAAEGEQGYQSPRRTKTELSRLGAKPTALLLDPSGAVGKAFRVHLTPEVRVVSPQGDVVYAGGVESTPSSGTPVRYVEAVLSAATSGRPIPYTRGSTRGCQIAYATSTSAAKGARAPDFTLVDSTGVRRRLSDYRGKWVILEWVNYDCPFVKKHYHASRRSMQTLQAHSAQQGIVWLSICSSARGKQGFFSPAQANARMRSLGAKPTAYLHDPTGAVGRSYGAKTTPDMRIISPQGTLEYAGGIDSVASMRVSDLPRSKNYVAAAIADIAARRPIAIKRSRPYGCSVKY